MSSAARIEELQKKFDENPRRYFAPLANECRKAGELDAAIAICRAHLPQQPGHMSGHIVYGQALFEAGELVEAKSVFETAIGLDPENLIALRHMGDIAARHGELAEARQWYTRVLETDPRNEEIQALVAGLGVAPVADGDGGIDGLPELLDPELLAAAAEASEDVRDAGDAGSSFADGPDGADGADDVIPTSLAGGVDPGAGFDAAADQSAAVVAGGFTLDGLESTSFEAPAESAHVPSGVAEGLELELPDYGEIDAAGHAPVAGLEPSSHVAPPPSAPAADAGASYPDIGFDMPSAADDAADDAAAFGESADATPAAPMTFVTETMAELYVSQGYADRALDVYRQLVAQHPDDAELRDRMERLSDDVARSAGAGVPERVAGLPTALDPALLDAAADAQDDAPVRAAEPGRTIRDYLRTLAGGAPVSAAARTWDVPAPVADPQPVEEPQWAAEPELVEEPQWAAEPELAEEPQSGHQYRAADEPADMPSIADDFGAPATEVAEVVDVADAIDHAAGGAADETADVAVDEGARDAAASGSQPRAGLDQLFGAAAGADTSAADTLAAAYGASRAAEPTQAPLPEQPQADPLSGRPARPAGSDLSLDHVFGSPRQAGAPRNTGSFSFDQFFADDGSSAPAREEAPDPVASPGDEEDLERFNSWLHKLKSQ